MQGILYEENSIWLFLLVTCVLGGWAAWMTGRAIARAWKTLWQALLAFLPLAAAVRFFHFALFGGTFLSIQYFVIDLLVVAAIGAAGFQVARTNQMIRQYRWLYERAGPFAWRERRHAEPVSGDRSA